MLEKCQALLASKDFFGILTDGSQARKTGDDKEMVLVKVEHNGTNLSKNSLKLLSAAKKFNEDVFNESSVSYINE